MVVPSACWPHAVFPGLLGNKGRKPPFYSITPAAPSHRANTQESGFIKTISARNETKQANLSAASLNSSRVPCVCSCCVTQEVSEWVDLKEHDSNSDPVLKVKYSWQLCGPTVRLNEQDTREEGGGNTDGLGWIQEWRGRHDKEWKEGRGAAWGPTQTDIIRGRRRGREGTFEFGSKKWKNTKGSVRRDTSPRCNVRVGTQSTRRGLYLDKERSQPSWHADSKHLDTKQWFSGGALRQLRRQSVSAQRLGRAQVDKIRVKVAT